MSKPCREDNAVTVLVGDLSIVYTGPHLMGPRQAASVH